MFSKNLFIYKISDKYILKCGVKVFNCGNINELDYITFI